MALDASLNLPSLHHVRAWVSVFSIALAIIWLWRDTGDIQRIAAHAEATFWLVLPTLPMFLAFPALLRSGIEFWVALVGSCALTIVLYLLTIWVLPKLGISL
jgi:hypothetical protein